MYLYEILLKIAEKYAIIDSIYNSMEKNRSNNQEKEKTTALKQSFLASAIADISAYIQLGNSNRITKSDIFL